MSDLQGHLTVKEVAERLGVNIYRVHQLINAGRLPAIKVGNLCLIRESDLILVADRKVGRPKNDAVTQTKKPTKKAK